MQNLKNKPLAVALAFAAVALALVFLVVVPLINSIGAAGSQIIQQQAMIDNDGLRLLKARDFISFSKQEAANFEKLDQVFVDSQMPLDFINSLEVAAEESNVKIEFSPTMPQQTAKNDWPSITIGADLVGGAPDIMQFMERLENSHYLLTLQSFEISTGSDAGAKQEIPEGPTGAHFLLKAYAK